MAKIVSFVTFPFVSVHPTHSTATQRITAWAGSLALRALFATWRLHIHGANDILNFPATSPVIYAFWHNRILAVTAAFLRVYPSKRHGVLVLTSASKDGMWLGTLAGHLGMGAVRGSSSRRGATAMRELMEKVAAGYDIAITPDGPRGPRYQLGAGLVYLAQKANIPIIAIHARFSRCLRLRTWDGFSIPLPFSRVEITLNPPLHIPPTAGENAFEEERKKMESVLRQGVD